MRARRTFARPEILYIFFIAYAVTSVEPETTAIFTDLKFDDPFLSFYGHQCTTSNIFSKAFRSKWAYF